MQVSRFAWPNGIDLGVIALVIGLLVFAVPTSVFVIETSWTGEEGAHGPIVLATGLWLAHRRWNEVKHLREKPNPLLFWTLFAVFVPLTIFARVTQIVEIEGYMMYATILTVFYWLVGGTVLRKMWFPFLYLLFIFPPPETVIAAITLPMKMWLSVVAIRLLDLFGYPIAGEGVRIYIGQYELLVEAACSGINSIISLTAISLFYIYMRHQADWKYSLLLVALVIPVALFANFIRVIVLILLTYHMGEAAAQGFLHNFAGLMLFAAALLTIFALDAILKPAWDRLRGENAMEAGHE